MAGGQQWPCLFCLSVLHKYLPRSKLLSLTLLTPTPVPLHRQLLPGNLEEIEMTKNHALAF
jgi:hypothetical protein